MKCNTRTMAAVGAALVAILAVAYTVFPSVRAFVLGIGPYLLILSAAIDVADDERHARSRRPAAFDNRRHA
ncbi:hypothetical protein LA354_22450 [Ralstonia pickettii]|uniref:hypothetical protein n=1 Tax=Ralstonia pickettii TaxID=329 RepID=UPI001CE33E93|nr:hypothetical protein [Ralstonia pickettii]UCA16648.1 hypothetical protein LA354_22450 [Ralstonia pickettii]